MVKCKACGKPIHQRQSREVRAWGNVRAFYHTECLKKLEKEK